MMKKRNKSGLILLLLLILGLVALFGLSGCNAGGDSPEDQVAIQFDVDPNPPGVGPSHLMVTLADAGGTALDGAEVIVEGNMDMDNMKPLLSNLLGTEGGRYEAPFVWTMSGEWIMTVKATTPDGREAVQEFVLAVSEEGGEHDDEHESENHPPRVPNDGEVIRLLTPEQNQTFASGKDVKVEVEFDNFELLEEGNHWHVYVDGRSAQMVMGAMNEVILRDLASGLHEISVFMSIGSHEELEDGASVTVNIEE